MAVGSQLITTVQNTLHGATRRRTAPQSLHSPQVLILGSACLFTSVNRVWFRSQVSLRPFPAHLSSTKDGCHGDCSRFSGSQRQSMIPNTSFTPFFPPFSFCNASVTGGESRGSHFCASAGAWKMSQTQQSTSHLCWFTKLDTQAELIITGRLFSSFLKLRAALLNHRSPGPFSSRNNKLLSLLLLSRPFGSIC